MVFESNFLVNGKIVTRGFMRRRFWAAALVWLAIIAILTVVGVVMLDRQVAGGGVFTAFQVFFLSGLAVAAGLLGMAAVFGRLERAVLASQAELIAARDKAVAAELGQRNILVAVSHELRTPMNGVLGFASLLIASDLKPEHRKQVEIIQSEGKALLALVNNILDFSKMESGLLELEDEGFSVEEVISDVVTLLRGSAVAKNLEISVRIDPRIPEILQGDANRLRQAVTNLVGNAIKFTDSGTISIEASEATGSADARRGCELQISVSDTGIGIPPGKQEYIFERFTQIGGNTRRKIEGTGLELAITKQIVGAMGGRIGVENTPGAGSKFIMRIPFAASLPAVSSNRNYGAVLPSAPVLQSERG